MCDLINSSWILQIPLDDGFKAAPSIEASSGPAASPLAGPVVPQVVPEQVFEPAAEKDTVLLLVRFSDHFHCLFENLKDGGGSSN